MSLPTFFCTLCNQNWSQRHSCPVHTPEVSGNQYSDPTAALRARIAELHQILDRVKALLVSYRGVFTPSKDEFGRHAAWFATEIVVSDSDDAAQQWWDERKQAEEILFSAVQDQIAISFLRKELRESELMVKSVRNSRDKSQAENKRLREALERGCAWGHHHYVLAKEGATDEECEYKCVDCGSTDPQGDSCPSQPSPGLSARLASAEILLSEISDALKWEPQFCCAGLSNHCYCLGRPTNPPPSSDDVEVRQVLSRIEEFRNGSSSRAALADPGPEQPGGKREWRVRHEYSLDDGETWSEEHLLRKHPSKEEALRSVGKLTACGVMMRNIRLEYRTAPGEWEREGQR